VVIWWSAIHRWVQRRADRALGTGGPAETDRAGFALQNLDLMAKDEDLDFTIALVP
jgi:hypothetical protein